MVLYRPAPKNQTKKEENWQNMRKLFASTLRYSKFLFLLLMFSLQILMFSLCRFDFIFFLSLDARIDIYISSTQAANGRSCYGQQVDDVGGVRGTQGARRQHQWCHNIGDDAIIRVYVRRLVSTFLQYSPMKGNTVIFFSIF